MRSLNLAALLVLAACGAKQGPSGANGSNGTNGAGGQDGSNGHSAVVKILNTSNCVSGGITIMTATDSNDSGALDSLDSNIMTSEVCNGQDGSDGQDAAPSAFLPVELLNPCGDAGNYDEVLLKLSSGIVLASFSENNNGKNTRFSVLKSHVNYQTTDGDACKFRIDDEGELYNESH